MSLSAPANTASGNTVAITATTSIAPMDLNKFIFIYSQDGGGSKICQAATTCTMHETYTSTGVVRHSYVAEVREFTYPEPGLYARPYHPSQASEVTIATSNRVTVTWWPL